MPKRPKSITTEPSLQHTPYHIPYSSDCDEHGINNTAVPNLELDTPLWLDYMAQERPNGEETYHREEGLDEHVVEVDK
jgi:hypothetical protein